MRRNRWVAGVVLTGLLWAGLGEAAPVWQSRTGDMPDANIRSVVTAAGGENVLAATPRQLYRFSPESGSWKRVLGVRSPDEVVEIMADPRNPKGYWLATRRTLRRSSDGGRSWKTLFRRDSESGFQIRTILIEGESSVLAGTTQGLYRLRLPDAQWAIVEGSPKSVSVESLVSGKENEWIVGTSRGIYKASPDWTKWELLDADLRREPSEEGLLGQFAIEEIASTPVFANAVAWRGNGNVYMGRPDGVYEVSGNSVVRLVETDGFRVRRLASDERYIYLATDRGVYRLSPESKSVENISWGLESLDVFALAADPRSGSVWTGTPKGIFRLDASEAMSAGPSLTISAHSENRNAFQIPSSEPSIAEIQLAAIRYAEVGPDKIKAWRDGAARKAWLPTVSLDTDFGEDHNVDIDRGGTNDPDRFIIGPNETNVGWSVGVSWDLGDLIWSNDQTSIDVRSRLMVELRNDILNDVTHLYFERRRVQMETALLPPDVSRLRFEKELKLQELTAQIDALTGGYLSRRLSGGEEVV